MRYFLGVDVGSTKTHALISDEDGKAVGFGLGGPGNHQGVSYDGLRDVLKLAVGQAIKQSDLNVQDIKGAGFGIGGFDWPSQLKDHLNAIAPLGLECPLEVVNDSIIGLLAGASKGWGIVLIAGTGNNCRGRDQNGREARITGEGEPFGEYGGASEIVWKAIQVVSYEWTRRCPKTALSDMFIQMTGAKGLDDLIEGIDLGRYHPDASWAPTIFKAAKDGDEIACNIISWSAHELAESGCAVIQQLGIQNREFEVVLAGSLFEGGDLYLHPLKETILRTAPNVRFIRLTVPPVVGGVLLGMQARGLHTQSKRERLIESTETILKIRT